MSLFEPPRLMEAEIFSSVAAKLRKKGEPSTWIDANHPAKMPVAGKPLYSHL